MGPFQEWCCCAEPPVQPGLGSSRGLGVQYIDPAKDHYDGSDVGSRKGEDDEGQRRVPRRPSDASDGSGILSSLRRTFSGVQDMAANITGSYSSYDHGVTTEEKTQDLRSILVALETELKRPTSVAAVGKAYKRLHDWTYAHRSDADLRDVVSDMDREDMYPPWRRQALEEAYLMFYEDIARMGDGASLQSLPEPPGANEVRPHTEVMQLSKLGRMIHAGTFEEGSRVGRSMRVEYEIRRCENSGYLSGVQGALGREAPPGREILRRKSSARYCACAVEPMEDAYDATGWLPLECGGRQLCGGKRKEKDPFGDILPLAPLPEETFEAQPHRPLPSWERRAPDDYPTTRDFTLPPPPGSWDVRPPAAENDDRRYPASQMQAQADLDAVTPGMAPHQAEKHEAREKNRLVVPSFLVLDDDKRGHGVDGVTFM